jgi:L-arabinose isomerase
MMNDKVKVKIGMVPLMADLYRRLIPGLDEQIENFIKVVIQDLTDESLEIITGPVSCTEKEIRKTTQVLKEKNIDLLVLAHPSYCASGQIAPALLDNELPILLWPAQPMLKLVGSKYDEFTVNMNHGVHGAQDLANLLGRRGRPFGILHGHYQQPNFKNDLISWAKAGKTVRAMKSSNPLMLGGHFDSMLDLQLDSEPFLKQFGVNGREISFEEFIAIAKDVTDAEIKGKVDEYRLRFVTGEKVTDDLLKKTARHEWTVRKLMAKYDSRAIGINFQTLCNDKRIADGLHVAASMLMAENIGYGGEGDWVTAMMNHGLQSATGSTTFSEIFSVGYQDSRLVLRHWGEGNLNLSRSKPRLLYSKFADENTAEFVIADFEYQTGPVTVVNLNVSPSGCGRLITMTGKIEEESLSAVSGPRGIFKPDDGDIRDILTRYDTNGGSHHSTMVRGYVRDLVYKIARLTGWEHVRI